MKFHKMYVNFATALLLFPVCPRSHTRGFLE